jgi:hypothetical protein
MISIDKEALLEVSTVGSIYVVGNWVGGDVL